jgi:hypothetical protein
MTNKFSDDKIYISQVFQTSWTVLDKVVEVVEFWFDLLPGRFEFWLVLFVVKEAVCLGDSVEDDTVNACD